MKNKFIRIIILITLLFSLSFLSFRYVENIKADSGWDSSYDSGGSSWDSSYDYDSGSSWDNDYGYDNDYDSDYSGGSGASKTDLLIVIMAFALFFCLPILLTKFKGNNQSEKNLKINFKSISKENANLVIPNFHIEDFNFKAYKMFYDVQIAWMNFDYDKLKELLTDELYNNYLMQLESLKLKNQRNTMKDFELIEICLNNLKEENGKFVAEVYLNVKFFDYIENINTGVILRGTPNRKLNNIYKLTFVRTKNESIQVNECPRCGALVEGNSTGICEYCKSKLVTDNYSWVISKKEKINQK